MSKYDLYLTCHFRDSGTCFFGVFIFNGLKVMYLERDRIGR